MRLLLFSDIHRDLRSADRLVELSASADVAVAAGDLATVHRGLEEVVGVLAEMACPCVLVPGNGETFEEMREACSTWESAHVLHGSGVQVSGQPFFGLGGGVPPTPFGSWSYDFTEDQAAGLLAPCPDAAVLISHSPPYGAVDRDSEGRGLGSASVRDAILRTKPRLVVCGHIHACGGMSEGIGSTPVVNAGPAGVLWDLERREVVASAEGSVS